MSPEDPNNPGLNTHPDLSSVPLPEPAPIKSPYAPVGGTLGDVANDVVANDSSVNPQPQPTPVPTPGIASDNPQSVDASAAQSAAPAGEKPKGKKLPLIIGIIVAVIAIAGIVLFFIMAKPFDGGVLGGGSVKEEPFYTDKVFVVSSEASGQKKYAIYNSDGEAVTDFIYDDSGKTFIGGTVWMKKDGKFGLVDQEGKEVVGFGKYGKITAYGGLYGLNKDGKDVLVNNKGETVTEYSADDFDHYKDYTDGLQTAYTLLRKDNHYTVYNPYGAKVTEFDSDIPPTVSSPDMGIKDTNTVVVYSGGVIVLNDKGGEKRRFEKNITKKLFGIFASKSGNIIGLSTVNAPLVKTFGTITTPDDKRENALIMGTAYYDYSYKECGGLYYNDDYVEGDEDGFVLCLKSSDAYIVTLDGSLSSSPFSYSIATSSAVTMIHDEDIYPIGNKSYATMTESGGPKTYSIFHNGKKVANFVNSEGNSKADTQNFTKTNSKTTYKVLGMNDSYIVHHIDSKTTYKFKDNTYRELVKTDYESNGEIIYMNKAGEKVCTFDKKGYTATTARSNEFFPGQKTIYDISSTDATGFINGIALVRKVGKNNTSFDMNGYTRINDKCEVVNEDTYYDSLARLGDLAVLTSKKGDTYKSELIDKEGKTIASATAEKTAPNILKYTDDFLMVRSIDKKSFIGYGKVLKEFEYFCNFGSSISVTNNYVELQTAPPSAFCDDKQATGGEHYYFLPNGKEFYKWNESRDKTE